MTPVKQAIKMIQLCLKLYARGTFTLDHLLINLKDIYVWFFDQQIDDTQTDEFFYVYQYTLNLVNPKV